MSLFNPESFLLVLQKDKDSEFIPPYIPVSMIDVDRMPPMSMDIPIRDNCPQCGGGNMRVGDYVCWGVCFGCYEQAVKEGEMHDDY